MIHLKQTICKSLCSVKCATFKYIFMMTYVLNRDFQKYELSCVFCMYILMIFYLFFIWLSLIFWLYHFLTNARCILDIISVSGRSLTSFLWCISLKSAHLSVLRPTETCIKVATSRKPKTTWSLPVELSSTRERIFTKLLAANSVSYSQWAT